MLGAICGDVIGSVYEVQQVKHKGFELLSPYSRFTDDSVLTVAVAKALLEVGKGEIIDYQTHIHELGNRYLNAGYGGNFFKWLRSKSPAPYNSWGNGSAMRVSPIGFAFGTLDKVLAEAKLSAEITHNHPEGVKGAQAIASGIFQLQTGYSKDELHDFITNLSGYELDLDYEDLVENYSFDVSCQGSVPQAIFSFLISEDFEDTIRTAVSIGGDSDTIACMAGGLAEAFYGGVPQELLEKVVPYLPEELIQVVLKFDAVFDLPTDIGWMS